MNDEQIRERIVSYNEMSDRQDGFILKLLRNVEDVFRNTEISHDALKNRVAKIRTDEHDSEQLIIVLEEWKEGGAVEHLSYGFNATIFLSYVK